ncbi:MAG TPA: 16S rRNA (cytosine(967)-C(5))-methyltransferase RsmB [Candidatus Acidoferrales bacterium]
MPISPARKIAFEVLRRVEAEGAYASDLLHTELTAAVKSEDAALATEIVMGVLRWRLLLDFLLERELKKPVARLDLAVLLALRMGMYQLRFLDRIPARAVVNEAAELVKRARKASAASLVNAVLRRASLQRTPPAELLPAEISKAERLGILYSHPAWMVERWMALWGEECTVQLLQADNRAPQLSCAIHEISRRQEIVAALEASGLRVAPGNILKDAISVSGGSPARTEAFRAGQISIQDEASQAIPLLLGVERGQRVLDLCAAPGGKTAALARAAGSNGLVIAADLHGHRLRAMQTQCERLQLGRVRLIELDAREPLPFSATFDRILVDAPCSGSGTLARHPEIRWRLEPGALAEFHALQTAILRRAIEKLAPGGRLVYSTCSLEPEENENVISEALRESSRPAQLRAAGAKEVVLRLESFLTSGIAAASLINERGQFHTFPGAQPCDGFFAAILESPKN